MSRPPYLPDGYVFVPDPDAPRVQIAATGHVVALFGPGAKAEEIERAAWEHHGRLKGLMELVRGEKRRRRCS